MTRKSILTSLLVAAVAAALLAWCAPTKADEDPNPGRSARRPTTRPAPSESRSRAPRPTRGPAGRGIDEEYMGWAGARFERTPRRRSAGRAPKPVLREELSEADRVVHKRLQATTPDLDFDGTALAEVIEFLRGFSGLNIHVNWHALEVVGIDKSAEVTLHLKGVTLGKALRVILEDVGGGKSPLGFIVDESVILISTKGALAAKTITRVYSIDDLIDWTDPELVGRLLDLIQANIDRESWQPAGDIGAINHLNGSLTVTQTAENHAALSELLDKLRAATTRRPTAPRARARQAGVQIKLVGSMKEACFDPAAIGLIAVAGLRDEVPRKPAEIIEELEVHLARTRALGLRNAIRLALKDLYRMEGKEKPILKHLREMLEENDAALVTKEQPERREIREREERQTAERHREFEEALLRARLEQQREEVRKAARMKR